MRPVRADDQVGACSRSVGERHVDTGVVLGQAVDARVEPILGSVFGGLVEHVDEVAAEDLQLGHRPVAVECIDGHLGAAAAIGAHPGDAALEQRAALHPVEQTHPLDHVGARAAQVDRLPARPNSVGEFGNRHAIAILRQPEGQSRAGDPGADDQNSRLCHVRQRICYESSA